MPFAGELAALAAAFIWALATIIYARTGNQAPALFLNLIKGSIAVIMLSATVFVLGDAPPELTPPSGCGWRAAASSVSASATAPIFRPSGGSAPARPSWSNPWPRR